MFQRRIPTKSSSVTIFLAPRDRQKGHKNEIKEKDTTQIIVTMIQSIQQIIHMNNHGVSLLGSEDDQKAVSAFTTSLLALQKLLGTGDQSCPLKTSADVDCYVTALPAKESLRHLEGKSYYIYNRPLAISLGNSSDIQLYSACTILNLAMAYHRQAKKTCNNLCTKKAESMYDMIITLLQSRTDPTSMSVRIIAVNNISEIHYESGRFDQAREELQWLSAAIHQGGPNVDFFEQRDLDLLLLNILVLLTPPHAAAAA
ncbi:unnamed protein product [Cylindrotheca closterium]|uniref:Uncharacterized protein n=1 Tax=Cylindrotheca closterium TaxID=2856 RepID=A0AAD2PV64_9STRA|nr:unnamed protein product [Cylindrotheca closterium]